MSGFVKFLLIFVGIALLLPGFCSLYFIFEIARTSGNMFDLGGLFVIVWGGTFIIAALGVWLIRTAVKQRSSPRA